MTALLLSFALGLSPAPVPAPSEALLRTWVAEAALRQVPRASEDWQVAQRDCAGFIRYAFRSAYLKSAPARVQRGLWRDARGRALSFADAGTLLASNFVRLGRAPALVESLRSGDVLGFRQETASGEPTYHLMLVVRTADRAHAEPFVMYHPGQPGEAVRSGRLSALTRDAPLEWRPVPENAGFLGYFRFKEWMR